MSAVDECVAVAGPGGETTAWFAFQRAHRALSRELEARLARRHRLSLSELELLGRLVLAAEHRGRLSGLAGEIALSVSRVSRMVDGLEHRGLVRREPCPDDARATEACLTEAGLALVKAARRDHVDDVRQLFLDRLDAHERAVLGAALARLAG